MDFNQFVQETNAKFEAATPAEKRVIIAQDVIERLKVKNLIANTGTLIYKVNLQYESMGDSLKEVINKENTSCVVCGKGALLCAFVGRVNKFTVEDALLSENLIVDPVHKKLLEIFSKEQLDLIETAFEGSSYLHIVDEFYDDEKSVAFYEGASGYDDDRLIAIMENIIENKGTFIP